MSLRETGISRGASLVALAALVMLSASLVALATSNPADGDRFGAPQVEYPTYEYDHRFNFARIKFEPMEWGFSRAYTWGLDLKWNHDYPQAEQNFARVLEEITGINANSEGGNLIELSDPRLFDYPWVYLCEPGFWNPTEEELENLRQYLARGGSMVIDDFFDRFGDRRQWANFERQIERLFPLSTLFPLELDQPVFQVFFELDDLDFSDPQLPDVTAAMYGIFEDNDPAKRLLIAVNYNMDIGDYWEWSDQGAIYPKNMTEKGFRLGINYLMYSLTH